MKYVVITLPPLLLFIAVLVAGEWLTRQPSQFTLVAEATPADAAREQHALRFAVATTTPLAAPRLETPRAAEPEDPRVPRNLAAPLRAVAADISLCVSQRLERDLGPIDIDVRFTPVAGGGFAQGTQVTTTWDDPNVADCVAEVFDEATFLPEPGERFEPSEFVFHFPDDAMTGLLGLSYSPFH